MVAANERRPYFRTVVLLSVSGCHSPLILCDLVTYLDPECCKLLKKNQKIKSKCDQDLLHSCIIRATEMLNKATQILTFSCRQITNSCSRISENQEISSYFNCKNANSVMVIHGAQHTTQFMPA